MSLWKKLEEEKKRLEERIRREAEAAAEWARQEAERVRREAEAAAERVRREAEAAAEAAAKAAEKARQDAAKAAEKARQDMLAELERAKENVRKERQRATQQCEKIGSDISAQIKQSTVDLHDVVKQGQKVVEEAGRQCSDACKQAQRDLSNARDQVVREYKEKIATVAESIKRAAEEKLQEYVAKVKERVEDAMAQAVIMLVTTLVPALKVAIIATILDGIRTFQDNMVQYMKNVDNLMQLVKTDPIQGLILSDDGINILRDMQKNARASLALFLDQPTASIINMRSFAASLKKVLVDAPEVVCSHLVAMRKPIRDLQAKLGEAKKKIDMAESEIRDLQDACTEEAQAQLEKAKALRSDIENQFATSRDSFVNALSSTISDTLQRMVQDQIEMAVTAVAERAAIAALTG